MCILLGRHPAWMPHLKPTIVGMVHKKYSAMSCMLRLLLTRIAILLQGTLFQPTCLQCPMWFASFFLQYFTAQSWILIGTIRNRMVVWYLLADIAICASSCLHSLRTFICQVFNLQFYCFCEKLLNSMMFLSERQLNTQSFYAYFFRAFIKFFINIIEQSPIAGSPSVNTLFYVTNNEVTCIFSTHGFFWAAL